MSCKTRRVTLNPSPYPDNTMSRRYCQPHMGAVYDAGQEPELRVWNPENPVTHPNCMCTYVPIGPPEIFDGPTEINEVGTYTYGVKCGPTPYSIEVDDDRVVIDNFYQRSEEEWEHPKVAEFNIELVVLNCDEDFEFNLTAKDKDEDEDTLTVQVRCMQCCDDPEYEPVEIDGDGEVTSPGSYMYLSDKGCPPHIWTIEPDDDDYHITESGVVQLSAQACGSFNVAVTDKCEQRADIDVRIINQGYWVSQCYAAAILWPGLFYWYTIVNPHNGQPCNAHIGTISGASHDTITVYSGKYKYVILRCNCYTNGAWRGEDCFLPDSDRAYIEPLFLQAIIEYQAERFYAPSQGNCPEGTLQYVLQQSHIAYNGFDYFGFRYLVPQTVYQYIWNCEQ